jgi:Icc-related predicted phosphoesterase
MTVGYPSNVLIISDYEKDGFHEPVRFRIDFTLSLGDNNRRALEDIYQRYRKPIFAVRGDRDGKAPFPRGVVDVHLKVETYRNWTIGGFGGTLWRKDRGPDMWSETEAGEMLNEMPGCAIFICHNPVLGMTGTPENDTDQGSDAIRRYIAERQPKVVYHGHVGESLAGRVGTTAIVSVHGYRVVHL